MALKKQLKENGQGSSTKLKYAQSCSYRIFKGAEKERNRDRNLLILSGKQSMVLRCANQMTRKLT